MLQQKNFLELVDECRPFVTEIDISTVKQKIIDDNNVILVDVREDYEWQNGHILSAIHLSRGIIERDINSIITNKNTNIILYCAGGYRSVLVAFNLQKMGYTHVSSMIGGVKTWMNAGNSLTD